EVASDGAGQAGRGPRPLCTSARRSWPAATVADAGGAGMTTTAPTAPATHRPLDLEAVRVDHCPHCQDTPALRRMHGPTAGPTPDGGWRCTRCHYEAVDLEDAAAHA